MLLTLINTWLQRLCENSATVLAMGFRRYASKKWAVVTLDFPHSLFSQVIAEQSEVGNRLNGFRISCVSPFTWLKPGVNERKAMYCTFKLDFTNETLEMENCFRRF